MGWQSETEVVRMSLSCRERAAIIGLIQGGNNGSAFIREMASVLPCAPDRHDEDNWGPKYACCVGPPKTTSDDMWGATRALLSLPCARAHLDVKEVNLSSGGHPGGGGVVEIWVVLSSALLRSYLCDFREAGHDMPEEMWRVLHGAHEENDGTWQTVIIKHTVV